MTDIDITKPVELRNKWKVEVWKIADGRIWGRYYHEDDCCWYALNRALGGYYREDKQENGFDLINVPEVIEFTVWGNVYVDGGARVATHTDKHVADACGKPNRAVGAAVPIHVRIEGGRVKIWGGT